VKIISTFWAVTFSFFAVIILSQSCANPGAGPGGGDRDSIPPVIIAMHPEPNQTNFIENEISITFDEYIVLDNLSNKLVISPPLAEKPTIKTKGKTVFVKITEDLIPNRTYSIDFKDGVKDYNEGNKVESIRMLFSTYDYIDTLRIDGYLLDAFTLKPVENATATLYTIDEDSVFSTMRPDFIAKVDEKGYFLFDNLPQGKYKLYGLVDIDNNLLFSQVTEQIAYIDSFIVPDAEYINKPDTLFENGDTLISVGYTNYSPEPVFGLLFSEYQYIQYLSSSARVSADKILLTFNESVSDSFQFNLINQANDSNWNYAEFGLNRDSISIWITDTTLIQNDSLYMRIAYTMNDTLFQPMTQIDTLKMFFSPKKKSKKEETSPEIETFIFSSNHKSSNFDLNTPVLIESESPLETFEDSLIHFRIAINDSTFETVDFTIEPLEGSLRKFKINYETIAETNYIISIDSAVIKTLSGISNLAFESKFKTQSTDYYGAAIFKVTGIEQEASIQLLKNSEDEEIIKSISLNSNQKSVVFDYLKPGKYIVKLVIDTNQNGKWDTGKIDEKIQPEAVYYFDKIINIKSNWELKENWVIEPEVVKVKELVDPESKKDEE
jgi:hypothetical protein